MSLRCLHSRFVYAIKSSCGYLENRITSCLFRGPIHVQLTQLAHNSGPLTARQRYAIQWRIAGGPLVARRCVLAGYSVGGGGGVVSHVFRIYEIKILTLGNMEQSNLLFDQQWRDS